MKTNGNDPINTVTMRQTGDDEYRLATERDIREGIWLSARGGLTKREYFAALAMQGMLSAGDGDFSFDHHIRIAKLSVAHADTLIDALNKEATHE